MAEPAGIAAASAPPGAAFDLRAEAVAALARERLRTFLLLYPRVLAGDDVEAIHDFRVASRRLQQALDFLYPPAEGGPARKARRIIRRARRAVSLLRNQDVTLELLQRRCRRTRSQARRAALDAAIAATTSQRPRTLNKARKDLVALRLDRCSLRIDALLTAGTGAGLAQRAAGQLAERWAAFAAGVTKLVEVRDPEHLHRTRIEGKRLRYLLELLDGCDVPGSAGIVRRVRAAQTAFGDWLDEGLLKTALVAMIPDHLPHGRALLTLIQQSDGRAQHLLAACVAGVAPAEMAKTEEMVNATIGRLA